MYIRFCAALAFAATLFGQNIDSSRIRYTDPATGGIQRTLQSKLTDSASPKDFGALGDGITNDTTAFQNALNSGAKVIDGAGLTYYIANLYVPSNTTVKNAKLLLIPGSATPTSGLIIDGTITSKNNIAFSNVTIDGQRKLMTSFGSPSDGDKSCFLLMGNVSNVLLDNINGSFCGTDGLQIWSYNLPATDNDSDLRFHHIVVQNSVFKYNRRQGISADSLYDVTFRNITAEYNGLDMAEVQTLYATTPNMSDLYDWQSGTYASVSACNASNSTGDCAARTVSNKKYAAGIDVEGYGVGSGIDGLSITGSALLHNAAGGIIFTDPVSTGATGFQPRQVIKIVGNSVDQGLYPGQNFPWNFSINIDPNNANVYQDITVTGNILSGPFSVLSSKNVTFGGNQVSSLGAGFAIFTGSVTNFELLTNSMDAGIHYVDSLGTFNQEQFPRVAANSTTATVSNYSLNIGGPNTPLMIGSFSGFNAQQSFGAPLSLQPDAAFPVLIGTTTTGTGLLRVGSGFNVTGAGAVTAGTVSATTGTFTGQVYSSSGGFKFPDGTTQTSAGIQPSATVISVNTNVSSSGSKNQTFIASGNITVTLYAASAVPGGIVTVKKTDTTSNTITIASSGGTLDGQTTLTLVRQYDSYSFISDGTNWNLF